MALYIYKLYFALFLGGVGGGGGGVCSHRFSVRKSDHGERFITLTEKMMTLALCHLAQNCSNRSRKFLTAVYSASAIQQGNNLEKVTG